MGMEPESFGFCSPICLSVELDSRTYFQNESEDSRVLMTSNHSLLLQTRLVVSDHSDHSRTRLERNARQLCNFVVLLPMLLVVLQACLVGTDCTCLRRPVVRTCWDSWKDCPFYPDAKIHNKVNLPSLSCRSCTEFRTTLLLRNASLLLFVPAVVSCLFSLSLCLFACALGCRLVCFSFVL